jgi:lipopolysaccharide transport system ATP-binding protein
MDIAISVKNLSKKYHLYESPQHRMKEALHPFRKKYHRDFWALKDVSFEVKKGETVGIIGKNGSGKSTLLQIICGTLTPSGGEISVNGRISALLELGAGFNPEFTGKQNIYMNGALMGFTEEQMDERYDAIDSFADIGEFIDQPVKIYSSGMYVRLAFAAAINVNPDILVVDEALSVGDMFFQAKCMAKMKKMMDNGTTLLFVSHDTGSVKSLCQKALLLNDGQMILYDSADKAVERYFEMKVESEQRVLKKASFIKEEKSGAANAEKSEQCLAFTNSAAFQKTASFQRIQNGKANFVNVQLLDELENELLTVEYEQTVILRMAIEIHEDMDILSYGYHIRDKNGVDVIYTGSNIENSNLTLLKKGDHYILDWLFKASLMHGTYNIACVLGIPLKIEIGQVDFCDFVPLAVQFQMVPRKGAKLYGYVHWDNKVIVEKVEAS